MRELAKLGDDCGYDPYNHVGCDMRPEIKPLGDQIFVMSELMRKKIMDTMMIPSPMLHEYGMIGTHFMGARVITPRIFPTVDA